MKKNKIKQTILLRKVVRSMAKSKVKKPSKKVSKNSFQKTTKKKLVLKKTNSKKKKGSILKRMDQEDMDSEKRLIKKEEKIERTFAVKMHKYFHTHLDNYASKHGRRIEGTLFFLNFMAIILFIIDTYNLTGTPLVVLRITEFSLVGVFILEYAARMWVSKSKVKHFFNIYSIIDLIAILPILVNFVNLTFFRIFRILRMFRILRILRFQRIFKGRKTMFGRITESQLIIIRIVLTLFTIIFVSSGLIWAVESWANPAQFNTIWGAMYFVIVTISTVGYGDVTPISPAGKAITILMILSGIALIPWQLGKLVRVIVESSTRKTYHEVRRKSKAVVPKRLIDKIKQYTKEPPMHFIEEAVEKNLKEFKSKNIK
jgi:voltage-gated potassium channel